MDANWGMQTRSLFGDNMSLRLPADVKDVSKLREIPDNQEVFAHPVTDQSIVVEVLEYVQEPDLQALRTHFEELASANDALGEESSQIQVTEVIPQERLSMKQCPASHFLSGDQLVSKFNEPAKNRVTVHMGLFRLPQFSTDILVTFNDPACISPQSSSHGAIPVGAQPWTLEQFREALCSSALSDSSMKASWGEHGDKYGHTCFPQGRMNRLTTTRDSGHEERPCCKCNGFTCWTRGITLAWTKLKRLTE